jgi:hypothetical protein
MRRHFAAIATVAALAMTGAVLASPPAEARKGGSQGFEANFDTGRTPMHGYSGPLGVGRNRVYCDYQRIPVHDCSSGRCKVVSWTLKQHCF